MLTNDVNKALATKSLVMAKERLIQLERFEAITYISKP